MKVIGIVLIVLGILGLIFGGFSFTTEEEVADIGPLEVKSEKTRSVPVTPIASGAAVVAGIALVVVGTRRRA